MKNELDQLIELFLLKNKISFNKEEIKIQLLSHPYYPSLNSITDLFTHFNIDNLALEVTSDSETFSQLPNIFLAELKEGTVNSLVIVSKPKERKKERKKMLN
jgi:hypothetical protein